jgi:hypothetical protein
MKQTAVEWLEEELGAYLPNSIKEVQLMIEQAKKMERQQIIDAHGVQTKQNAGVSNYIYQLSGEKYYEQTFKQEP